MKQERKVCQFTNGNYLDIKNELEMTTKKLSQDEMEKCIKHKFIKGIRKSGTYCLLPLLFDFD